MLKNEPKTINLSISTSNKQDNNDYRHLSIDLMNQVHLECDTSGLIYLAQHCLLVSSKSYGKLVVNFKDRLPAYEQKCIKDEVTFDYDFSIDSTKKLNIINSDYYPKLLGHLFRPINLEKQILESFLSTNLPRYQKEKLVATEIKIPALAPNEYPNINKHKDGFLWVRIIDDTGYVIGNTRGLNYLIKHLIYVACHNGIQNDDFHYHLYRNDGDLDSYSMDLGIYNIDFRNEKFRNDYYKYR